MTTSLYLVRHVQATGNLERRFQGRTDNPPTEEGLRQARLLARRFGAIPLHAVYTSPLTRAVVTAERIARSHGLRPCVEEDLTEMDGGVFEDRTIAELEERYPEQYGAFCGDPPAFRAEGAETYAQVYERMGGALERLLQAHEGQTIVAVSHGVAIRCLLARLRGLSPERIGEVPTGRNGAVSHIVFLDGAPRVIYSGDLSHLGDS